MDIKHMACSLQVKALAADGVFTGYASVFGIIDEQSEIVAPGAFARTLDSFTFTLWLPMPHAIQACDT